MSNTSPGQRGQSPLQSPASPRTPETTSTNGCVTPFTHRTNHIPISYHRRKASLPASRIPAAPPYSIPRQSRKVQNFTPTRPSPLSKIFLPPADPDFDLIPKTNIDVSPGMNIDPTLLNWPDDNADWPDSDELDEIFGPLSPSPAKSRVEGGLDITELRSPHHQQQHKRDFTLIPAPLSLKHTRRGTASTMFGDLMPAPLSPSRCTMDMTTIRPLPATSPQRSLSDHVTTGRKTSASFTPKSVGSIVDSDWKVQQNAEQTCVTGAAVDGKSPSNEESTNPVRPIAHKAFARPSSGITAPSQYQPSTPETLPASLSTQYSALTGTPNPDHKPTLMCNLCLLQFHPSHHSLRPDINGRAYCAQCIKTVGDRIVEEQKIKMGIGRSGTRALARERTRVGGLDLGDQDSSGCAIAAGSVVPMGIGGSARDTELDELWYRYLNTEVPAAAGPQATDGVLDASAVIDGLLVNTREVGVHLEHGKGIESEFVL